MHEGNRDMVAAPDLGRAYEGLDKPVDECGVFGIYAPGEPVSKITYGGLHELQHRGQSGAGIYVYDRDLGAIGHKGVGLVDAAISEAIPNHEGNSVLDMLAGSSVAIGHTRYSTSKENDVAASQPFKGDISDIAVSHNGHIEGIGFVAEELGVDVSACVSDSHVLTTILDESAARLGGIDKSLADILPRLDGAYCLTIMDGQRLIGARDPWGFHPLVLGRLPENKGYVLASEPVAFAAAGATLVRDIAPGEIISIGEDGIRSTRIDRNEPTRECTFEYAYIARPDSYINGVSVSRVRENLGANLAANYPAEADVVVGVPSSGIAAAEGYAEVSGLRRVEGIYKNPYVARSFMERGENREAILSRKLRPNKGVLEGQRIVLVDDSLIKGNTMKALIGVLRKEGGVKEVHVRLSAPRYEHPCFMGLDTGDTNELIARHMTDDEICTAIGADSIGFNSPESVERAIADADKSGMQQLGRLCTACATGEYPFPVPSEPAFVGMPGVRRADEALA